MTGARKSSGQDAMLSILRKLESMIDSTNESYEKQITILSSTEAIMKNEVSVELKKQTNILMSIESKLNQSIEQKTKGDTFDDKEITAMSKSLGQLVKVAKNIKPKLGDIVKSFLTKVAEGFKSFTESAKANEVKEFADSLSKISKGVLLFTLSMVIATPLLIIAAPGAVLFGLTIRLLMKSAGAVDKESANGIAAVVCLGKGALLFGLVMAGYAIIAPIAIIGAVLFGLTIKLLMKSAGAVDKESDKGIAAVIGLGKGALLFGLAMAGYAIIGPLAVIGSVLFGLSIFLLGIPLFQATLFSRGMKSVLSLAKGVLLYSLAMLVVTALAPAVIIGSVLFGLSLKLLLKAMSTVSIRKIIAMRSVLLLAKGVLLYSLAMLVVTALAPTVIIGSVLFGLSLKLLLTSMGRISIKQLFGMYLVQKLAKGVLFFSISMVLFALVAPIVILSTIVLGLTFAILSVGLRKIGSRNSRKGIGSLLLLSIGIYLFGLVLSAYAKSVNPIDSLITAMTIAGFGLLFYIIGKGFTDILKGALSVVAISISIAILGLALLIYSKANLTLESVGILGAVIVGLGLAMFVAGKVFADIVLGSAAMIVAGGAIIVLSMGLLIYSKANITLEDAGILGLIVVGLGTAMGVAGLASPFIIAGSGAMILAGVSLIIISAGLAIFKASGFDETDGKNLTSALGSVVSGFLGGEIPGGLVAGIKFAAKAAARSLLLLISVPPMILAGAALMLIVPALSTFKKAGFNSRDGDNLEYMIGSVVRAFGIVTDTERQKQMGFSVNPLDLMIGVNALAGAGNVLSSLAAGVQAWAKLEVYDWEVINAGTKDAKLVIKGKRKLSKSDFENAAAGMAAVISAISEPFAKVGRLEKGESSGDPLYDMIFGGGFVSAGIEALARSGDTIVSLAKGVQAFATMEYTQFEVIGAGTKDAKLVPKGIFKLGKPEIDEAAKNIATVIGIVAEAFAQVGRDEAASSGIFSGGFVSKGVKALAGVGENLGAIVDSVLKMANREIPTFDLIGEGTKDAKLVPGKPKIISDTDLTNAATTIMSILKVVAQGFYDIGKDEDDSSSFWGDGFITKGVKALGGLGDTVAKVTDSVLKIASGEIPQMKEVDGKLVPGAPIKITSPMIMAAGNTIKDIMMVLGTGVYEFGKFYSENKDVIDKSIDVLPNMTEVLANASKPIEEWTKLKDTEKIAQSMVNFMDSIKLVFDPEKNTSIKDSDRYFTSFTSNIEKMASPDNTLDKAATNVAKIEKSMKLLKETINSMDLQKLTLTDSLMKSLAILSKNPEAVAKAIEGSIEKSFKELVDAIKEVIDTASPTTSPNISMPTASNTPVVAEKVQNAAPTQNQPAQLAEAIAKAMKSALAQTINVNVKNTTPIPTTGG